MYRFQWTSLQVHQIVRCKTETSVWKHLENLPDALQNAYYEIWHEIDNLEEPDRTLAQRAMLWLMAAYKPMDSEKLISAIRVGSKDDECFLADEIDEQGLLSLCNNFLVIDSKLKVWRFSHLSVTEYLQSKHQWTPAYAHTCAATVSLSFFINIYKDEDPSTVAEDLGYDSDHCDPADKPVGPWEIMIPRTQNDL
ncbi:uncharacterized protein KD926_008328 [Aspergillus affinis]|uniref:uncharacterized protein n=1 Tax=Aspergillus affinis TaxID=1070780 RepID=UPI0022FDCD3E|nr:uncharacterized protein KD926_008328 [Aspergillus affinis]KAI9040371.1 hypothetical protein KD926_008328 [Aspergillus affinis]